MRYYILGGVIGYTVATVLIYKVGPAYGCGVIGLTFGGAFIAHNDRSRWLVGLFLKAIDKHMARKAAAHIMGVQASQISRWDSGEEQASLNRLAQLPNEVIVDAVTPLLQDLGLVVVPSGRLASATAAMLKLAAAVEAPASATLPRQRSA